MNFIIELCKSHLILGILFWFAHQTRCDLQDFPNCTSNGNCGTQMFCINGICSRCVDCELEYNRKSGNNSASCTFNKTNSCGECLPNFSQAFNGQNVDDVTKCVLISDDIKGTTAKYITSYEIQENFDGSAESNEYALQNVTNEDMDVGDRNAPWPYIAFVGTFLLIFSGLGTFLSWKYQPTILEMKKRRQRVTIKYRQKCEDIRNASVKEKQKLSINDEINLTTK